MDDDETISDDELCSLAVAADPDAVVEPGTRPLAEILGEPQRPPLPEWYMPMPAGGAAPLRGWRRSVVVLVISSFLVITGFGLCNTYGQLHG